MGANWLTFWGRRREFLAIPFYRSGKRIIKGRMHPSPACGNGAGEMKIGIVAEFKGLTGWGRGVKKI